MALSFALFIMGRACWHVSKLSFQVSAWAQEMAHMSSQQKQLIADAVVGHQRRLEVAHARRAEALARLVQVRAHCGRELQIAA